MTVRAGHRVGRLRRDAATCVQLYLRDPAGNLVEVDAPGASGLPAQLRSQLRRLADVQPQNPDNLAARLYLIPGRE